MASLTACATTTRISDIGTGASCPDVKEYSKAEQKQVADELEKIRGRGWRIGEWIADYGVLRNQVRACKS